MKTQGKSGGLRGSPNLREISAKWEVAALRQVGDGTSENQE